MADLSGTRKPFIAGSYRSGTGGVVAVTDPATEERFAEVEGASPEQFLEAIFAARGAFDSGKWPSLDPAERVATIRRFASALETRRDVLVETLISEIGCPRPLAEAAQVDFCIANIHNFADLYSALPAWEHNEVPLEFLAAGRHTRLSFRRYEPVGVVAAIAAYNGPLLFAIWKAVPALLVGCTVVLRPSPLTPLATLALGEAAQEAGLPAGVFNVVAESGNAGAQLLTTHPAVDAVTFTGSVPVGRAIAGQAAPTLKRLILELGGKSAQLHLPDVVKADFGSVVQTVVSTVSGNAGQACVLQSRVLVPESAKNDLLDALVEVVPKIRMGDPREATTQLGPLITSSHRDRVAKLVEGGVDDGARLVTGGPSAHVPDRGWFHAPTVVAIEDNSNSLAQTEVFGPVVTVQGYSSIDEAVAIANDTELGLSNGVYTSDMALGLDVAARLRSGAVHINERSPIGSFTPMGGMKQSGIGRERGVAGIRAFQEVKNVIAAPR